MPLRIRLPLLVSALILAVVPARAGTEKPGDPAAAAAEAKRLYDHANDFVSTINEGDYSYAYIQFHWKRAQSNLERIQRVYPETPTGRALKNGELKIGAFDLAYFKDRVLARLEDKRLAAFDAVNCAVFLAETRGEAPWDDARRDAAMRIVEVLSRQKRWNEALKFPVPDRDEFLKRQTVFRVAARFEQNDLAKELLAATAKDVLPRLHAIQGEAMALRGLPRKDIAALLDQDSADGVKLAVLSGMIEREVKIQRTAALRLPMDTIFLAGGPLKRPEVRDDVTAVAKTFFPMGNEEAATLLATYRAALGERPAADAATKVHLAYLEHLAAFEKFDELDAYLRNPKLAGAAHSPSELKVIELFARAGRMADAERFRTPYTAAGGMLSEAAALAQFRGQMDSTDVPLTVHEKTFANLPIKDPCILAQAIMEWSLTPNRSVRGAAPYDAVVQKFAPGYANLAAPKSNAVRDAASASKPF